MLRVDHFRDLRPTLGDKITHRYVRLTSKQLGSVADARVDTLIGLTKRRSNEGVGLPCKVVTRGSFNRIVLFTKEYSSRGRRVRVARGRLRTLDTAKTGGGVGLSTSNSCIALYVGSFGNGVSRVPGGPCAG